MVGFAVCRPQINTFMNATFPELEELSDEDLKEFSSFMKIIRDSGMTKEQKLEEVRVMLANESAEETKEALEQTELAIELNDWLTDQTKNTSPKVKEAIFKIYDLLCDVSFLKKTPADRIAEIEEIVKPLSDSEKKELEQLDEISKKKAKDLGIELPSQITKKRR
ncbi:hypothetical protein ANCCAN_12742 [Ancylostoma caninum]|uniref:Uncharacterized protein n=1 Tax=Ancylostoma caninum TaxID=29170 RepID=A0A368GC86_ANCCA|nr:hypothetical protein ANCCAN_12742 [Ancylostoma caninum]